MVVSSRGRGQHVRFIPNIRYGTEQYPDKIARRLRAVNIAALIAASSVAFVAIHRFLDSIPHWKYAAVVALIYVSIPLLHRCGPLAGPLTFVGVSYVWVFWVSSIVGTNGRNVFSLFDGRRARHPAGRRRKHGFFPDRPSSAPLLLR